MNEVFKNSAHLFDLEKVINYHYELGISVAVNDGKDVTMEIEKPLSLAANKGQR